MRHVVLTVRELDVARLLVEGLNYREVGACLELSPRTVEYHAANIRRKTRARNNTAAVSRVRPARPRALGPRSAD